MIEIAREGAAGQPPGRVLSPGLTRGQWRDIVRQRPHKRLRGVVQRRPLLVMTGDRSKTAILAFTAPVAMHRSARIGGNQKGFSAIGECGVGNLRRTDRRLLTATPLHFKAQKIADYMRRLG
jgi:hypothetical protein